MHTPHAPPASMVFPPRKPDHETRPERHLLRRECAATALFAHEIRLSAGWIGDAGEHTARESIVGHNPSDPVFKFLCRAR